eukprot:2338610-Pleurochrysis_carterae.AAC.1
MVPASRIFSGLDTCLELPRRMNSASSTSVSRLYAAHPPGSNGSTNGSRSVDSVKSLNQDSAVPVRRVS